MYNIIMRKTAVHDMGDYVFATKKETMQFLEELNPYELEQIIEITKYNKASYRNAYYDFFEN